jgi:chitinase
VSGRTRTAITLAWNASGDDVGVTGYDILRNGVRIRTVTTLTVTDGGRSPGTTYTYIVRAVDAAGNRSGDARITATTRG